MCFCTFLTQYCVADIMVKMGWSLRKSEEKLFSEFCHHLFSLMLLSGAPEDWEQSSLLCFTADHHRSGGDESCVLFIFSAIFLFEVKDG